MKNKIYRIILFVILTAVIIAVFITGYQLTRKKIIFPNQLFIRNDDVIGVDISSYQDNVDMEVLKEQDISFVYIKATEGSSYVDEFFHQNWEHAKAAGMPSGAYHFFSFESLGKTQAENYIRAVGESLEGRLIPALDLEYYGDTAPNKFAVVREVRVFLKRLEEQYGVKPVIYASKDFYDTYLKGFFDDYPRWGRNVYYPLTLEIGSKWTLWQYMDRGQLRGYDGGGYIDLNVLKRGITLEDLTVRNSDEGGV